MIISASRRTDIPAFFSEWFFRRFAEGYVYVKNPMNRKQLSKIILNRDVVDCIVFWTKNPYPMLNKLCDLGGYSYYFQFTVNSYDHTIEKNVPRKSSVIQTFKALSDLIGPDRVVWRYDPIFFTPEFSYDYHLKYFELIASRLAGYTRRCVISFFDKYRKCESNMKTIGFYQPSPDEMTSLAHELYHICKVFDIDLETCAEEIDLSSVGVKRGKCIDDTLVERIAGRKIVVPKDSTQRLYCGCVSSIDIGAYDTCLHNCIYCYANVNKELAVYNYTRHDPQSALLDGQLKGDEIISVKKMASLFKPTQMLIT